MSFDQVLPLMLAIISPCDMLDISWPISWRVGSDTLVPILAPNKSQRWTNVWTRGKSLSNLTLLSTTDLRVPLLHNLTSIVKRWTRGVRMCYLPATRLT